MPKSIRCECGFIARGQTDDDVIGVLQGHISSDHPDLVESLTRDDLRSWIQSD